MAKVGVRWLEPERDVGKTTFVKVTDLICDRSKDLPAGTVVKAKWKSTGRVYRATLLNNLMAKSRPKESSRQRQPVVPSRELQQRQPNEDDPDSDEDDDMPLAYQANTAKAQHELQGESQIKILQDKIDRLEKEAITMASELKELKSFLTNEFLELKTSLTQGQTDSTRQIQAVFEAVSQSHDTARSTQDLIKGRVAAREKAQEMQRSLLNNNGKRIEPAFGVIENGSVTKYQNDRKLFSVNQEVYRRMFDDSKTGTSFLRKLLKHTFSDEELAESNFSGGSVVSSTGIVEKKCLDRDRVLALLGQVELEFPNSTKAANFSKMRDTINEECRRVVRHIRREAL